MTDSIADRVTAGAEWLNENGPAEWWDRVNIKTLRTEDAEICVLGQVFQAAADECGVANGYSYALDQFFYYETYQDVHDMGFSCVEYGDYPELDRAWRDEIENIRAFVSA